jgi:hypothetical protein
MVQSVRSVNLPTPLSKGGSIGKQFLIFIVDTYDLSFPAFHYIHRLRITKTVN